MCYVKIYLMFKRSILGKYFILALSFSFVILFTKYIYVSFAANPCCERESVYNPSTKSPCGVAAGCWEGQACQFVGNVGGLCNETGNFACVGVSTSFCPEGSTPDNDLDCTVTPCESPYLCNTSTKECYMPDPQPICGKTNNSCDSVNKCCADWKCVGGKCKKDCLTAGASCTVGGTPCCDKTSIEFDLACIRGQCLTTDKEDTYVPPTPENAPFYDLFYNGPTVKNIESILNPLGKILFWGGLFIGMAFIVIAGYTLMTSEGNPQKTQEGQEQLTAAILGIAFILLSSAILRVIISLV